MRRYEKTKSGFLVRKYKAMKDRVNGVGTRNLHLYVGKNLLPKEEFYKWAMGDAAFHDLFSKWEASGYDRRITPSVDRIRSSDGYMIGNMQWLTHRDNSIKAVKGIKRSDDFKQKNMGARCYRSRAILQYSKEGKFIREWACGMDAARSLGVKGAQNLAHCASGKIPSAYGYKWSYCDENKNITE